MTFTKQRYLDLKLEYINAVKNKKESFIFCGKELLTAYAKYLLIYLEQKLDIKEKKEG